MNEKPIIFSAPMVRALLADRKTQTRRIVNTPAPSYKVWLDEKTKLYFTNISHNFGNTTALRNPYGRIGDKLWVREGINLHNHHGTPLDGAPQTNGTERVWSYQADEIESSSVTRRKPSIHMPRWASRITLEITGVRVERLQDISEADAKAEGAEPWRFGPEQTMTSGERGAASPYRGGFACLWDDIHEDQTWFSNPWVWVLEFKRVKEPNGILP